MDDLLDAELDEAEPAAACEATADTTCNEPADSAGPQPAPSAQPEAKADPTATTLFFPELQLKLGRFADVPTEAALWGPKVRLARRSRAGLDLRGRDCVQPLRASQALDFLPRCAPPKFPCHGLK